MKTAKPVRYDEIEGKVVSGAGFGWDRMLIAFTDGTVLALTADESGGEPEIDFAQGREIDLLSKKWHSEAMEAGLITQEEYRAADAQVDQARIAALKKELASLESRQLP